MPSRNSTHMLPYGYPVYIYIYLILLNIYIMNGSVLPTTARSQIKRGGGGGGGGVARGGLATFGRLANSRQGFQN